MKIIESFVYDPALTFRESITVRGGALPIGVTPHPDGCIVISFLYDAANNPTSELFHEGYLISCVRGVTHEFQTIDQLDDHHHYTSLWEPVRQQLIHVFLRWPTR